MIGVLTQPLTDAFLKDPRFKGKSSYIMTSYIDSLESAGARTVPLIFDGNLQEQLAKIDHLNGVFYCGGGAGGAYDTFGKHVYDKVKQLNDQGKYLPIWGTCLGFENLAMFSSDNSNTVLIGGLESDDENYVLHFLEAPESTRMFGPLGDEVAIFKETPIAYNHHSYGVSPNRFMTDRGLAEVFTPIAISYDNKGTPFVAAMESKNYPFFGVQFHPEKAQFVYYPETKIDHSEDSIFYNRYFADFFVDQCRMSDQKFATYADEIKSVTENWEVINTEGYYGSVYVF
jgi:gamma-glutamyl hydrolase